MTPGEEMEWLAARRPRPDDPSATSTGIARASLLAHARRRRRRRRVAEGLTASGVLAAAAGAVVLVTGVPTTPHRPPRLTILPPRGAAPGPIHRSPTPAAAPHTPLTRLAADVSRLPDPRQPGNATLVVQDTRIDGHHEIDGAIYGGYNLYTDRGVYYYAASSLTELQQSVDAHQPSIGGSGLGSVVPTLARLSRESPQVIRRAMYRAEPHATAAQIRRQLRSLPPRERRRYEPHKLTPAQARLGVDSLDYIDATEALEVGAGRPDVRAGAMKVLSTLHGVHERETRLDGVRALRVTYPATLSGRLVAGQAETIWLDARTGVPIQERVGATSATRYIVLRVDSAHLPTRVSQREELR